MLISSVLISRPHNLAFLVPESLGFGRCLPGLKNGKDSESEWKWDTLKMVLFNTSVISLGWLEMPGFAPGHHGHIHGRGDFWIM